MDFIGIDYGSKLAGTTALCFDAGDGLRFRQSLKKQDADALLIEFLHEHKPAQVFIDAPLSLPAAFISVEADDYFYRKADRELRAMSPMFLGGLTARAIRLANQPECKGMQFFESYPRGLVDELSKTNPGLSPLYKSDIGKCTEKLLKIFELSLRSVPNSWHQVDALLAYCVGIRKSKNQNLVFGDAAEGLIYV